MDHFLKKSWRWSKGINATLVVAGIAFLFFTSSCSSSKCVVCEMDNHSIYRVKFNDEGKKVVGKDILTTNYYPIPLERSKKKKELYLIDCDSYSPYSLKGKSLEEFIRKNLIIIDKSKVDTIINTSDADIAPNVNLGQPDNKSLCNRFRQPLKIEIRGMAGVRDLKKEGMPIPGYGGLDKKILGFGGGGTNIIVGAEAAILPRIARVGLNNSFNLGLLTGFWPVDSGLFVPIALHPRFTFNEFTMPLWGQCNAFYLFGDIGAAYDARGNVKFLNDNYLPYSWFYGIGGGIDLWKSRNFDLSFDLGFRRTNLALPINQEYIDCINNQGNTEIVEGYPVRSIGQLFFRFGLTF